MSNFSFCQIFFKSHLLSMRQNAYISEKGLSNISFYLSCKLDQFSCLMFSQHTDDQEPTYTNYDEDDDFLDETFDVTVGDFSLKSTSSQYPLKCHSMYEFKVSTIVIYQLEIWIKCVKESSLSIVKTLSDTSAAKSKKLLKTLRQMKKLLIMINFSFCHNVFNSIW